MIHTEWRRFLNTRFEFIAQNESFSRETLIQIARGIQVAVDDDPENPITSVYESSIWGIAQAYLVYTQQVLFTLPGDDLVYIRQRSGILGMWYDDTEDLSVVSYRDLLDTYDPGFGFWLEGGHFGPPAA